MSLISSSLLTRAQLIVAQHIVVKPGQFVAGKRLERHFSAVDGGESNLCDVDHSYLKLVPPTS
jgi:hypothetical protein